MVKKPGLNRVKEYKAVLYRVLRAEMISDPPNWDREYQPSGLTSFLYLKTQQSTALCSLSVLLTSAQRSAEVRALQRALSFGVCMSALCGLRFTDFGRVAFSCKQRFQFRESDQTVT